MRSLKTIRFLIFLVIVAGTLLTGYTCARLARGDDSIILYKQRQFQRMKKCRSLGIYKLTTEGYWLSEEPSRQCCDLNFDGYIDFFDYALFLRDYTENYGGAK